MLPMNKLLVYPTSRAIRKARSEYLESDVLLPHMMRMDEFEQRLIFMGSRSLVDPLQRVLLLQEAADFKDFKRFKIDKKLVKFLSSSESFFRFFEELSVEKVDLDRLAQADAYAEFGTHIEILSQLRSRYGQILQSRGLYDRMLVPDEYSFNEKFVSQYNMVEVYLEGLLSRYEIELLKRVSRSTDLIIHFTASPFGDRMIERFESMGISIEKGKNYTINLSDKKIISQEPTGTISNVQVLAVQERYEQIAAAFVAIEEMVSSGIDPSRIALVLPDESFKEPVRLYDKLNNLNFAMGFNYSNGKNYKILDAIAKYLAMPNKENRYRLERYEYGIEKLDKLGWLFDSGQISMQQFVSLLDKLQLSESDPLRKARVEEALDEFVRIFADESLKLSEWLHLWLRRLSNIRIDDLRGGLITVMGVLETRGVEFDGVVIVDFNEDIVPTTSAKDQFLNTQVRLFADLPTRSDREALQKHYYYRLLSGAKRSTIIYASGENKLPSKFLYELGLDSAEATPVQFDLLYDQPSQIADEVDPLSPLDPYAQVWSSSRLSTWLSCKRKFYYRYIKGVEAKPQEDINEGAVLHRILDRTYKYADSYTAPKELREALWKAMDMELGDDGPKTAYHKILWKQKLEAFIEQQIRHFADGWRIVERECEYQGEIYGLKFKGRIDRVDIRGDEAMVIDYKSGKLDEVNRSKHLENAINFQMNIYRHLLCSKYPNAAYVFQKIIDGGEMIEAKAMDEKEEYLKSHLEELADTREFTAQKTDKLSRCTYCEFALLCGRGEYL